MNVAVNVCKSPAKDDFVEWYHIPTGFLFLKGERAKIIHVIVYIV